MLQKILSANPINADLGLLVIRVGIGLSMLLFHGWDKITGGPERWAGIGGAMENLGLSFAPTFWGFMAAFSESICSVLLIVGVLFRPAAALLAFTMFVGWIMHLTLPPESPASGWNAASHAMELMLVYIALVLTGAGKYAVQKPSV